MVHKIRLISWSVLIDGIDKGVSELIVRRVVKTRFKRKWKGMEQSNLDEDKVKVSLQWALA
jgi:hypothetical protein